MTILGVVVTKARVYTRAHTLFSLSTTHTQTSTLFFLSTEGKKENREQIQHAHTHTSARVEHHVFILIKSKARVRFACTEELAAWSALGYRSI